MSQVPRRRAVSFGCVRPDPQTNADWNRRFERNEYEPQQEWCVAVPDAAAFVARYADEKNDCYPIKELCAVGNDRIRFVSTLASMWHWSERVVPAWRSVTPTQQSDENQFREQR